MPSCSDLLPFNHSVTLVSMNNTDDKPKVGRDWIAFVVAWIPYSLLTYRFWYNVDDAFISFRYAKNWAMGYGPRYNLGPQQPEEGYSNFLWVVPSIYWSSLNFPVKSPYGSPRSVKLLIPPTCLAGEARCEAPRLS